MTKTFFLIGISAMVALFMQPLDAFAYKTVDQWEQDFQSVWQSEYNTYEPTSRAGDAWLLYNLGYAVDANHAMFVATGDTQYLDRALEYIENAIDAAQTSSSFSTSQFKDGYLAWINHSHPSLGNDGKEYPLFESYMWRYVTSLLRVMKDNGAVFADPTYRAKYDTILAFTEEHIWKKWHSRSVTSHLYRSRTHMASHWARIAMNLYLITEDQTKKAQYKKVWDDIDHDGMSNWSGASLRGQMIPFPGDSSSYFWNDVWNATTQPGQDVAHGNAVMSYISESASLGYNWSSADMQKFVNLLDDHIWKTGHAQYVDGSGTGNGWYNDGFLTLGRFNVALQERIESVAGTGNNTQKYGNMALNAYILDGGTLGYGEGLSITSNNVIDIATSSAKIEWNLDRPATGQIEYGLTNSYGSVSQKENNYLDYHLQPLANLTPGSTYYYRILSTSAQGADVQETGTFTTTGSSGGSTSSGGGSSSSGGGSSSSSSGSGSSSSGSSSGTPSGPGGAPGNSELPRLVNGCHHVYHAGKAAPTGYATPINYFTSAKELLMTANCNVSTPLLTAGSNQANQYVYNTGYAYHNTTWTPITLNGTNTTGDWVARQAIGALPYTLTDLNDWQYVVAYTCVWANNKWSCGCEDATCAQGVWQLQAIQR